MAFAIKKIFKKNVNGTWDPPPPPSMAIAVKNFHIFWGNISLIFRLLHLYYATPAPQEKVPHPPVDFLFPLQKTWLCSEWEVWRRTTSRWPSWWRKRRWTERGSCSGLSSGWPWPFFPPCSSHHPDSVLLFNSFPHSSANQNSSFQWFSSATAAKCQTQGCRVAQSTWYVILESVVETFSGTLSSSRVILELLAIIWCNITQALSMEYHIASSF